MGLTTRFSKDDREAKCRISEDKPNRMICKARKTPKGKGLGQGDGIDLGHLEIAIDDQGNKRLVKNALKGRTPSEMKKNQSLINAVLNADITENPNSSW